MIEAAVVGLGRWGQAIVNAVQGKSARLKFVRGVCKEPDAMAAFAGKHGFELSTQFDDVVADPRVRAVVLATPHSLHVDQVVAVAKAGKAVWCEKPLALTLSEAERAVAACRRAGVVLGLGNSKRTFASMLEMKRVVASGMSGQYRCGPIERDVRTANVGFCPGSAHSTLHLHDSPRQGLRRPSRICTIQASSPSIVQ